MALPASGQITMNQVNVELGNSGTAQIDMNSAAVRGLFGIASGEIEMADGYGKSNTVYRMNFPYNVANCYVTAASSTDLALGTGDYTLEWWHKGLNPEWVLVYDQGYGSGVGLSIWIDPAGAIALYYNGASGVSDQTPNNVISMNTWYHIAVVRYGSSVKIYVDGTLLLTSTTLAVNLGTQARPFSIAGAYSNHNYQYEGSLSNIRLVKGTAVYTSAFTSPTANLTNISGTVLLTGQNSTIVDNSSAGRTLTVSGSVTMATNNPPF